MRAELLTLADSSHKALNGSCWIVLESTLHRLTARASISIYANGNLLDLPTPDPNPFINVHSLQT